MPRNTEGKLVIFPKILSEPETVKPWNVGTQQWLVRFKGLSFRDLERLESMEIVDRQDVTYVVEYPD